MCSQAPESDFALVVRWAGVAIPKPPGIGLWPVVVGRIMLRFVGTLALVQKSAETPLQVALGLAGGCELMGAAIGALLSEHVGWVDVAADAKNALNSFCRSQMRGPLGEPAPKSRRNAE